MQDVAASLSMCTASYVLAQLQRVSCILRSVLAGNLEPSLNKQEYANRVQAMTHLGKALEGR